MSREQNRKTLRLATIHRAAKALEVQQSFLRQQLTKEQGKQIWDWIGHKAQGAENGCPKPAKNSRRCHYNTRKAAENTQRNGQSPPTP
jgi:acyl-CoA reductase-like NAD-dependent aldehyde dehydrogenase